MGLYNVGQWEEFLKRYVVQISSLLKKERIKNPITGKMEDADLTLIEELEKIVEAPADAAELENFRRNVIAQVGAWSLDHQNEPMVYAKVFPEFWAKIQRHYYEGQKSTLTKMHDALLLHGSDREDLNSDGSKLARQTIANMVSRLGYEEQSAREAIIFLMRKKY
jgi:predicted Ser/Thr protein kinase